MFKTVNNPNLNILEPTYENINLASEILINGGVVSFPTETVYSISCSCFSDEAIDKVYEIKKRSRSKPLIIHFGSTDNKGNINVSHCIAQIRENFITNDIFDLLAKYYIPGPLTLILNKKPSSTISKKCNPHGNKLGFRVPNNPIAQELLHMSGPCVSTSANVSSYLSPVNSEHVIQGFKDTTNRITILKGGQTPLGIESTVLDISDPDNISLLRHGTVSINQIQSLGIEIHNIITPEKSEYKNKENSIKIRTNATSVESDEALLAFGEINFPVPEGIVINNLSEYSDPAEAAQNLFDLLWELESQGVTKIAIMPIPNEGLGIAINNKLIKISNN